VKQLSQTKQFARDIKLMKKRGKDLAKIAAIVRQLAEGQSLDPRHRDHPLGGEWAGTRDCHIEGDWLFLYSTGEDWLRLERTGSHSDLFR
jgi:mRNA interferase YafQ